MGARGVLSFAGYLSAAREGLGAAAFWDIPTLLWLRPTDGALLTLCCAGALSGLVAAAGFWQRTALGVCLPLWISLCSAGQDFLSFQWDILLCEAGFLAIFADATRIRVWLFRWLLFRLMFFSGAVKLLSQDVTWRNLTAMAYHYETQPLPTPLAWYLHHLPVSMQKASTLLVFACELIVPFLFFAPARLRHIGAWITIALQILIMLSGNYTFFNLLTIALAIFLFVEPAPEPDGRIHRAVSVALAAIVGALSLPLVMQLFSIPAPALTTGLQHLAAPLRLVNSYGLFAVMTTERKEIEIEGSEDGTTWKAYSFPYKPGDVYRAPPIVAPHQPRLDWQMWFAALGSYQENRWFTNLMIRILQGEPAVTHLLRGNPFPNTPPKFVRARLYLYHFSPRGDRAWWTREDRGLYFPTVSLK